MVDEEVDGEDNVLDEFELGNELSALAASNLLPLRIIEKIEKKLKKNKIQITKNQLNKLVEKISNIMRTYAKFDKGTIKTKTPEGKTAVKKEVTEDYNMQKLVETIDSLKERITNIEKGVIEKDDKSFNKKETTPKLVTTDDIKVHEKISVPIQDMTIEPLNQIPNDPESIVVLMKWLQYLIDKCGRIHLREVLDYYVDIDWLTEDAKIVLIDYSHGITEEQKQGDTIRRGVSDLPAKGHIQSLVYIQKLKGIQFDRHFLDRIDGELSRITKKIDTYRLK